MTAIYLKKIFTKREVEDFVAKVLGRKKKPPMEDVEKELRKQDAALLKWELACERNERVRQVARNFEALTSDKIQALGGESSLTPFQLLKFHDRETTTRPAMAALELPRDLLCLVLGNRPSSKELAWYTDITEILGGRVKLGSNMVMEVNGEDVPGDLASRARADMYSGGNSLAEIT